MATRCLVLAVVLAGCAELGVVSDGTSISVGKASNGYLIDGARLPDHGEGFTTRDVWRARDNRFGTDELIDLIVGVARRMHGQVPGIQIVIADLSSGGGGERYAFHRSHQSGRDADFLYYLRDATGQPFEPDAMHVFDPAGRARDGSGLTVDVPRTWLLVKELITAPEAPIQWIFIYEPLARRLLDHAARIGEPEALIARARRTLKQPGDSARHDDHMHVRVYCAPADRVYGCIDLGPMELLVEREAEPSPVSALMAALTAPPPSALASPSPSPSPSRDDAPAAEGAPAGAGFSASAAAAAGVVVPASLGRLLRARADHLSLRGWR
ncbi:MAG TPA: penicillin-insensitive murein endopeptidase [Kofleriaceae bacterium]|jgi:penicillin-insensitive murein endopeptidase|nr:penicillin-insensitive murein endopeptidase [Kofleriaceae bacterium]